MGEIMIRALSRLASPVLALPRPIKRGVVLALDAGLCVLSVWLAFYLRLGVRGFGAMSLWAYTKPRAGHSLPDTEARKGGIRARPAANCCTHTWPAVDRDAFLQSIVQQ